MLPMVDALGWCHMQLMHSIQFFFVPGSVQFSYTYMKLAYVSVHLWNERSTPLTGMRTDSLRVNYSFCHCLIDIYLTHEPLVLLKKAV